MKKKWKGVLVLFFLLGASTLLSGSLILYRTYEMDNFEGSSIVMGKVVDIEERPIEGVVISYREKETTSDDRGEWRLEGVDEGLIKLYLYKDGYVLTSIKWFVYPISEVGKEIKGSVNDISASFDIELQRELETVEIMKMYNDTLGMRIDLPNGSDLEGKKIFYKGVSNKDHILEGGENILTIEGNGTFEISFSKLNNDTSGPSLHGIYPPGSVIDINEDIRSLFVSKKDQFYQGETAFLSINWSEMKSEYESSIEVLNQAGELIISENITTNDDKDCEMTIIPGIYRIQISGRHIRDRSYRWIYLNNSEKKTVDMEFIPATEESIFEHYSIKSDYTVSIAYIILSVIIFIGGLIFRKRGTWALVLVIALLGFLTWGMFGFILNINTIFTIILIFLLIRARNEYNTRRHYLRKAKRITG
ncbi:MAG: hypothetical protein R6V01_03145 [Thermoplasmatota archaeon]